MPVEIPKFLRHLPTFGGYPIPFVQLIGPDGTPDFKVLDHNKLLDCIKRRACSICGHPMRAGTYCFIGGEKSIMHCAPSPMGRCTPTALGSARRRALTLLGPIADMQCMTRSSRAKYLSPSRS
jgi:hypothetical protein